jgi:hypothetical protein
MVRWYKNAFSKAGWRKAGHWTKTIRAGDDTNRPSCMIVKKRRKLIMSFAQFVIFPLLHIIRSLASLSSKTLNCRLPALAFCVPQQQSGLRTWSIKNEFNRIIQLFIYGQALHCVAESLKSLLTIILKFNVFIYCLCNISEEGMNNGLIRQKIHLNEFPPWHYARRLKSLVLDLARSSSGMAELWEIIPGSWAGSGYLGQQQQKL